MDGTRSDAGSLTPEQAAREILRVEKRDESLLGRTIGLTWMIWGLVNAGIFLTYEAIGGSSVSGTWLTVAALVAWAPWVAAGGVVTTSLWGSLQLVLRPGPERGGGYPTITAVAIFLALIFGGVAVITVAKVPFAPIGWAMFAVGLGCALAGGLGVTHPSPKERLWWLAGGALLSVTALGIAAFGAFTGHDTTTVFNILAPVGSTAVILGGGWYATSLS